MKATTEHNTTIFIDQTNNNIFMNSCAVVYVYIRTLICATSK